MTHQDGQYADVPECGRFVLDQPRPGGWRLRLNGHVAGWFGNEVAAKADAELRLPYMLEAAESLRVP